MKRFNVLVATFVVALLGAFILAPVASVGAIDPLADVCSTTPDSAICQNRGADSATSLIGTIVNVLLFVVGILSVIMIIVSGIFYVTSSGDAGKLSKAKNTLTYSIVGLLVSFLAFAIVNWVFELL